MILTTGMFLKTFSISGELILRSIQFDGTTKSEGGIAAADLRDVKLEYKTLKEKIKEYNKKDAKFYSNMFAKMTK